MIGCFVVWSARNCLSRRSIGYEIASFRSDFPHVEQKESPGRWKCCLAAGTLNPVMIKFEAIHLHCRFLNEITIPVVKFFWIVSSFDADLDVKLVLHNGPRHAELPGGILKPV